MIKGMGCTRLFGSLAWRHAEELAPKLPKQATLAEPLVSTCISNPKMNTDSMKNEL